MRLFVPLSAALLIGTVCFPAHALTLKNMDSQERKLVIKEKDKQTEKVLKPSETLTGFCSAPCEILTADGEVYDFDGNEYVTIEEGILFIGEDLPTHGTPANSPAAAAAAVATPAPAPAPAAAAPAVPATPAPAPKQ
jgi:hypothetical protein